jgi:hypothetical protein
MVLSEKVKRRPWEKSLGGRKKNKPSTIVSADRGELAKDLEDFRLPRDIGAALFAHVFQGGSMRSWAREYGADHRRVSEARRDLAWRLREVM